MKKRLVALLTAAVLVLAALPAALADGQIRILPIDMSGGAGMTPSDALGGGSVGGDLAAMGIQ